MFLKEELDVRDEQSQRLSELSVNQGRILEEELVCLLENSSCASAEEQHFLQFNKAVLSAVDVAIIVACFKIVTLSSSSSIFIP